MKQLHTKWIGLGLLALSAVGAYSQTSAPAGGAYEQKLYPLGTKPMPILSTNFPVIPPASAPAAVPVPATSVSAGCANASGPSATLSTEPRKPRSRSLIVEQEPPLPRPEVVPLSPGPNYAWIPGYWSRHEGNWVWHGGEWILRPAPGFVWVDGHWSKHGRGWIWMSGHWR